VTAGEIVKISLTPGDGSMTTVDLKTEAASEQLPGSTVSYGSVAGPGLLPAEDHRHRAEGLAP
jgi:hypothetical protein